MSSVVLYKTYSFPLAHAGRLLYFVSTMNLQSKAQSGCRIIEKVKALVLDMGTFRLLLLVLLTNGL
jgi:hypothetical protein